MSRFFLLFFIILVVLLAGCATAPSERLVDTCYLRGVSYISVASLARAYGLNWTYDSLSQTVRIAVANRQISLRVGDRFYLLDGQAQELKYPIDIYQGVVVVPYSFKRKVIEPLVKKTAPLAGAVAIKIRKVVVDAGHGGQDPGAISKVGVKEKDINLDIAKRLAALLQQKNISVIMTRNSDRFIPLEKRAEIANFSDADIFVSIHANSNRVRSFKGLEVYCINSKIDNTIRAQLVNNSVPLVRYKDCLLDNSPLLKTIVWDMILTANHVDSLMLAKDICRDARRLLGIDSEVIKEANFQVLRGTFMPGVLVEVGYLSNSEEERLLKNSWYRQQLAEVIMQGIIDYATRPDNGDI